MKKYLPILAIILLSFLLLTFIIIQKSLQLPQNTEITGKNEKNIQVIKKERRLNLSGQQLEKLPEYVVSQTNLEELDISNNNISGALPAEIRHLQNLRLLNASNNKMTGVPAEIGQLSKLEFLDLSNNQLTGLPYEMGNLKNLKTLNLSGNNYSKQDLEVIKKGLSDKVEIIL